MKKIQLRFYVIVFLLLPVSLLRAQGNNDSLLNKIQNNVSGIGNRLDSMGKKQDTLSVRVTQMEKKDSAARSAVIASFSAAYNKAKNNPAPLYAEPFPKHMVVSIIAFLVLALFLYKSFDYFRNSAICRDESFQPDNTPKDPRDRPYSYSRVQLFWWTIIILFCFTWFYAMYGVLLPLNSTIILLLGGGLAVMIFGKTIDNNQLAKNRMNDTNELNNQGQPIRHQDLKETEGFLTDILSDDNGISIHRLQAVVFNLVFGIAFLGNFFTAIQNKQYPFMDFENWQLALLGISAAGYLGLKTSENSTETRETRRAEGGKKMVNFNQRNAAPPPKPGDGQ